MKRATFLLALCFAAFLVRSETDGLGDSDEGDRSGAPDLVISNLEISPDAPTRAEVRIENAGTSDAPEAILRLALAGAAGSPAGNSIEAEIPPLEAGSAVTITLDAASILPPDQTLAAIDFHVEADASEGVAESDESNNRRAHSGIAPPVPSTKPDLTISRTVFSSARILEVRISNTGGTNAGASILSMEISAVDGQPSAPPPSEVEIPPLAAEQSFVAVLDLSDRVPEGSKLRNAVFELTADLKDQVDESNESNNGLHHPG